MRWQGRREAQILKIDVALAAVTSVAEEALVFSVFYLISWCLLWRGSFRLSGHTDFSGQSAQRLETQEEQQLASLSKVVLADTETVWGQYFRQMGKTYSEPTMVLYNGVTPTACCYWSICNGPILLPSDRKVYLDLSFYNEMKNKLGAAG